MQFNSFIKRDISDQIRLRNLPTLKSSQILKLSTPNFDLVGFNEIFSNWKNSPDEFSSTLVLQ